MKKFFPAFLLLLVLGGIWGYSRIKFAPPVGGKRLAQLPPAVRQQRRADAHQLEKQVKELVKSGREHENKRFTIVASEDQINTLIQDRLKVSNLPISNPRVGLQNGVLAMQGDVNYKGFDTAATLEGTVRAENGKLVFDVESLEFGLIKAPAKWRNKLERELGPKLNELLKNAPGQIDRVTIGEGTLTLEGNTG